MTTINSATMRSESQNMEFDVDGSVQRECRSGRASRSARNAVDLRAEPTPTRLARFQIRRRLTNLYKASRGARSDGDLTKVELLDGLYVLRRDLELPPVLPQCLDQLR